MSAQGLHFKSMVYQPAALYELALNALLFVALWRLRFTLKTPGMLFPSWLVGYSLSQFLIFFARDNAILLFRLKQVQFTALVVLLACTPLVWLIRHLKQGDSDGRGPAPGSSSGDSRRPVGPERA